MKPRFFPLCTPLTDALDAKPYTGNNISQMPVKLSTTVYKNALVMRDANGDVLPAIPTASVVFVGIAEETVTSPGSGTKLKVNILQGVYGGYNNSGSAALTAAHVGSLAYCEDDNTVKNAAGANGFAVGIFMGFDAENKCIIDTSRRSV